MDDVESAQEILHLEHPVDKGAAHGVDIIDEVSLAQIRTTVVVHPIDHLVTGLTRSAARENVHRVPLACQRFRQLGDVDAHPSNGDGVQ